MVRTACWSIVAIQEAFHCLERRIIVRSKLFFYQDLPVENFWVERKKKIAHKYTIF